MKFLIENWYIIIAVMAIVVVVTKAVYVFSGKPTEEQITLIREWLLYAVVLAEKELGSGTGVIKLRFVYDLFLSKFPFLTNKFTFEQFEILVNEALDEMKELLEKNENVKALVKGED